MLYKFIFLFSASILIACNNSTIETPELYANLEKVKTSEMEEYFNLKKQSPLTHKIPKDIHLKEQEFVNKIAESTSSLSWFSRGPNNLGGRTRALAIDVTNENRIVVGGVSGGIFISEDLGESFVQSTTPLQFHSVTCLAQDTRSGNENIWYYGTGEQNGNSSDLLGHGVYKSIDNGLTWTYLAATANDVANLISTEGDFRYIKDLKVNPTNGDIVVAAFSGIWISQDGGNSWTNVLVGGADPNGFGYVNFGKQTNIDVSPSGVFYATLSKDCIDNGIWRSVDGMNWTNITPAGFANSYRRIESGISESNEEQVFFIADVSTTVPLQDNHELWKYNATKNTWINKTANIPAGSCTGFFTFDFGYFQSQNSYDLFIAVHPTDTNLVFLGGTNLYRSTDGFSTPAHDWIGGYACDTVNTYNYVAKNHHPDNHAVAFVPNSNTMISAHDGGLSITTNCKANDVVWEYSNNGYKSSQFYTVAIEHGNTKNDIIIGGLQDNGTWMTNSLNPQQDWMNTFYGDGAYCAISKGRENYYISWQGGKTFKAKIDDNGNFENLTRIDPSGASDFMFINSFILDPTNNNTMYLSAGKFLWRNDSLNHIVLDQDHFNSTETGWTRINASNTFGSNNRISTLDMSEANSDIIYYGTRNGRVFKLTGLDTENYVRTNIKKNNMPSSAYVSCIEVDNKDANKVLLTYSNYEVKSIYYTENAGDSWVDVSGNLEEFENGLGSGPSVNWANIYYDGTKNIYFVGTTSGLFSTEKLDSTNTIWAREGVESIGNVPVSMISSRTYDKNIVVATHGNGIFSSKEFIDTTGIFDLNNEKNALYLSNIFPNPVNGKMKFTYRINKNSFVSIKIYNSLGRIIETLEESNIQKGTYEKRWFPKKEYANGNYFLVLKTENKTLSRQFILKN